MRVRTSGGMSPSKRNYNSYATNGDLQPQYCMTGYGQPRGTVSTMIDVCTPNFKERIRRGEIILSPMQLSKSSQSGGDISFSITHDTWGTLVYEGEWTTYLVGAINYGLPATYSLSDQVLIKAYAKMNSSPILIGETLGDLGKTFDMFQHPFKQARELLSKMDKFRLRRLGKTTASAYRAASSAWLEYRYGWKPVVLDCITAANIIRRKTNQHKRPILVARASETRSHDSAVDVSRSVNCGHTIHASGVTRCSRTRTAHAGVLYRADKASVDSIQAKLGYRPSDLAATVWERIPYSFVVDWFTNVGDWVQAWTPVPGISVLGNWVTTVEEAKEVVGPLQLSQTVNNGISPIKTYTGTSSAFTKTDVNVTRSVNLPLPPLPSLTRNPLSALHQVDAAALACNGILTGLHRFASYLRRG